MLRKARKGTKVVYLPGNHDEFGRDFLGMRFGDITLANELIHTTADVRQLLVLHGDRFDGVKWLSLLGSWAYHGALRLNHGYNRLQRRLGLPYWSLSAYLKQRANDFEATVAREARSVEVDGIVCGHIHHAAFPR